MGGARRHYRWLRTVLKVYKMKTCSKCKKQKPIVEFYRDKSKKDKLYPSCKICQTETNTNYRNKPGGIKAHLKANNKYKQTAKGKASHQKYAGTPTRKEKNKIIERRHRYKKVYGLSVADYELMLRQQKEKCLVCKDEPAQYRLCVDHDHETGKVRGLLCHPCNLALGRFEKYKNQFNIYLGERQCGV